MTDLTLEALRDELAPLKPLIAGIPLIHRDIQALRSEVRQIKAAVNDLAKLQMSTGEAEALHEDVDKSITSQRELEARILILERQVEELRNR